jgi:pentapeptide repeat protein
VWNFQGASIKACDLSKANLRDARCHKANFTLTKFRGADLSGADFSNCDCEGADFRGANLTGADFRHAVLTVARFAHAKTSLRGQNFGSKTWGMKDSERTSGLSCWTKTRERLSGKEVLDLKLLAPGSRDPSIVAAACLLSTLNGYQDAFRCCTEIA